MKVVASYIPCSYRLSNAHVNDSLTCCNGCKCSLKGCPIYRDYAVSNATCGAWIDSGHGDWSDRDGKPKEEGYIAKLLPLVSKGGKQLPMGLYFSPRLEGRIFTFWAIAKLWVSNPNAGKTLHLMPLWFLMSTNRLLYYQSSCASHDQPHSDAHPFCQDDRN